MSMDQSENTNEKLPRPLNAQTSLLQGLQIANMTYVSKFGLELNK
jgi:hypothetical protein